MTSSRPTDDSSADDDRGTGITHVGVRGGKLVTNADRCRDAEHGDEMVHGSFSLSGKRSDVEPSSRRPAEIFALLSSFHSRETPRLSASSKNSSRMRPKRKRVLRVLNVLGVLCLSIYGVTVTKTTIMFDALEKGEDVDTSQAWGQPKMSMSSSINDSNREVTIDNVRRRPSTWNGKGHLIEPTESHEGMQTQIVRGRSGKMSQHGKRTGKIPQAVPQLTLMSSDSTPGADNAQSSSLLEGAKSHALEPLTLNDHEQYTIRMNTWNRNEQLVASLNHHCRCEGVAKIHVVWCNSEEEPPDEVVNHPSGKVVVERHTFNSLNERFNVLLPMPTVGVLSLDDDLLRPCEALDSGFFRWTKSPDRLVGYDARLHIEEEDQWKYAGKSIAQESNRYSMVLLRSAFIHRDYLDLYMQSLPRAVFESVEKHFNCEDIAMSFFVSALTDGLPPLLADRWAIQSMTKLFSEAMISAKKGHKTQRSLCVETFSRELGIREGERTLQSSEILHKRGNVFEIGFQLPKKNFTTTDRETMLINELRTWNGKNFRDKLHNMIHVASREALAQGLVENSSQWNRRWGTKTQLQN